MEESRHAVQGKFLNGINRVTFEESIYIIQLNHISYIDYIMYFWLQFSEDLIYYISHDVIDVSINHSFASLR